MSQEDFQSLQGFLAQKGPAMQKWFKQAIHDESIAIKKPKALTVVEGRSGLRRIKIRNHQILADNLPVWIGYDHGPSAPELLLVALGACLSHMYLVVAGIKKLPIRKLEIETSGQLDLRKGGEEHEEEIPGIDNIHYDVFIDSDLTDEQLEKLRTDVEKFCPLYNLIKNPSEITSNYVRVY